MTCRLLPNKEPGRAPRPRMRATYTRTARVRHLSAALELGEDKLFGHIKPRKTRARFLEFCRYLRTCTRRPCGSRSSAATTARTSAPARTAAPATGPRRTTPRSPTLPDAAIWRGRRGVILRVEESQS